MKIVPGYPPWGPLRACAHCGRPSGQAWICAGDWSGQVCDPDNPGLPDCYRRVTVYSEPVGALLGVDQRVVVEKEDAIPLIEEFPEVDELLPRH